MTSYNSNTNKSIEEEYMIKTLLSCLEQEILAWNRLCSSSRSLPEYLMERSKIHNSKYLVSWGGGSSYYSHTYVFERRPYIYNLFHWASAGCNMLDVFAKRIMFTIITGAFEWSPGKPMFYIKLEWNKLLDKYCNVISRTTRLNQEIFKRSHLIKSGNLETYLYVEFFDDFNFDKAVLIIQEAYEILEREAMTIINHQASSNKIHDLGY